jgi:hypothetical protein
MDTGSTHLTAQCTHPTSSNRWLVAVLTVTLMLAPMAVAKAQGGQEHDQTSGATPTEFGIGAASVLLSIPYGAAKVTYAALGGIIGGFAYAFSGGDTEAAKAVWTPSLRGTYVLTPDHLKGDKPIQFLGKADGDGLGRQAHMGQPIHVVVEEMK